MNIFNKSFSLENSIILFLLVYLSFRIFSDFIFLDYKPGIIKAGFTALSILLIGYNYAKLINKTDIIIFSLASFFIVYPLLFSQEAATKQLTYDLKVFLTPLVILACSHLDISFDKLRAQAQVVFPIVTITALIYFFSSFTLNPLELYGIFDNKPFHTVSQTIAKGSFLFLHSKHAILFLLLGVLILLNVRSNLIPVLVITLFKNLKKHLSYIIFASLLCTSLVMIASSINPDFISIDSILERFITKNRAEDYAGEGLQNLSSGRTRIWEFYFNYISDNFTFINFLFGTGSLEMQGKYPLNAHNDFLNVIVNFGALGLFSLGIIYYEIYRRLDPRYKNYIAFYFVFVFFVNGIMFHQSNILFLLYLNGNPYRNLSNIKNSNNSINHNAGYANSFAKGQ